VIARPQTGAFKHQIAPLAESPEIRFPQPRVGSVAAVPEPFRPSVAIAHESDSTGSAARQQLRFAAAWSADFLPRGRVAVECHPQLLCGVASYLTGRGLADVTADALDLLKTGAEISGASSTIWAVRRLASCGSMSGPRRKDCASASKSPWPVFRPVRPNSLDRRSQRGMMAG